METRKRRRALTPKAKGEREAEVLAPLTPRLLTDEGAARYLGVGVALLRQMRTETPLRFTEETWAAALEKNDIAPIPFLKIGRSIRYDVRALDDWISRQRVIGQLPQAKEA